MSYLRGLFHNIRSCQDLCKSYFIKKILKGTARSITVSKPKLLPINKPTMHNRLRVLPTIIFDAYDLLLYKSIILISYYYCCCLRAGEVVVSNTDDHTLKMDQFKFRGRKLYIKLVSFNHCNNSSDFCIQKVTVLPCRSTKEIFPCKTALARFSFY